MKSEFSRMLSNLRKEKNLSQREVSNELEISQALLSHYEKGTREPKLAFVVRAADYYNVSCDYLLGRSFDKQGSVLSVDQIRDTSLDKDNIVTGSIAATLRKKIILNSISMIIDIVGRTKNKELLDVISNYFYYPIYKSYRYITQQVVVNGEHAVAEEYFEALCDAEQKVCEVKLRAMCKNDLKFYPECNTEIDLTAITKEKLAEEYPNHMKSVLAAVQTVSDNIKITTNPHKKTKQKKSQKK